jgi:hypothetical protein
MDGDMEFSTATNTTIKGKNKKKIALQKLITNHV